MIANRTKIMETNSLKQQTQMTPHSLMSFYVCYCLKSLGVREGQLTDILSMMRDLDSRSVALHLATNPRHVVQLSIAAAACLPRKYEA